MDGEARELKRYTDEEFYEYLENNDTRAELIDGFIIVDMGSPSFLHQDIMSEVRYAFRDHIRKRGKNCRVGMENEVRLDESNIVSPDIFVTCKPEKVDKKRMNGAPEFVLEIVSSNYFNDYYRKLGVYKQFGVREYWIVDPKNEKTLVYFFEKSDFPNIYTFDTAIPVGIYDGKLSICVNDLL